jgi:hypothetical protein
MTSNHYVLENCHVLEERNMLECSGDPKPGDAVGMESVYLLSAKDDLAFRGFQQPAYAIEEGCLAGAVRPYHGMDLSLRNAAINASKSSNAPEGHLDALKLQNGSICGGAYIM